MAKTEKLIVMPLTPAREQVYNGIGLGIHFFLGNIMAVHDKLTEFWFGWRVGKLFPEKQQLDDYCQGHLPDLDFNLLGKEQGIRYWLSGEYKEQVDAVLVRLSFADTKTGKTESCRLEMDVKNHFKGFFDSFFQWLNTCGLSFSEEQAVRILWPEKIDSNGLELLGRALETTYHSYVDGSGPDSRISTKNYENSIAASPQSFLAHDLYAWALYKNKDYEQAERSFHTALKYNENGFGALAGLMWCAVFTKNREAAVRYALAKAAVRNDDPEKARAFVEKKFSQ